VFQEALNEVPKSGEVWCEGARLAIHRGDLQQARKFLDFSLHFTPQYGDSLIEYLRLEMLEGTKNIEDSKLFQVCDLYAAFLFSFSHRLTACLRMGQICAAAEPDYGPVWAYCKQHPLDSGVHNLFVNAARILRDLDFHNMDISMWIATRDFNALSFAERRKIAFA
jgi:la-related protein 1